MLMQESVVYPSGDGRAIAETDTHRRIMRDLVYGLRQHYRNRSNVFVGGALFLFYEEGNPRKFVVPDVMVALGVPRGKREHYLVWAEPKPPGVVVEITSANTKTEDLVLKKNLYARLGVKEYYIFDPHRDFLPEPLVAFDLQGDGYLSRNPDSMYSPLLGLELRVDGESLRLHNPISDKTLPSARHLPDSQLNVRVALQSAERARLDAESRADQAEAGRLEALVALQISKTRAGKLQAEIISLLQHIHRLTRRVGV